MSWISLASATLLLVMSGAAHTASLTVAPLEIHLPVNGRPTNVRVTNNEDAPILVQVKAIPWVDPQHIGSAPVSNEVIAVPPIVEIPPGAKQLIRLALRRPHHGPRERAYRLVVSQVIKELPSDLTGVVMSLRLNLPMFATPKGAEPHASLALESGGWSPTLVFSNMGTASVRVREVAFYDGDRLVAELDPTQQTVLAGESVSWPLDLPLARLPATLELQADTNHGPISATLARPAP